MSIRRLWIVLLFVLLPAVAHADIHKAWWAGGGFEAGSVLTGVHLGTEWTPEPEDPADTSQYPRFFLIGEFSGHGGTHDVNGEGGKKNVSRFLYMGGVRWAFAIRKTDVLSAHVLVGGHRSTDGDIDDPGDGKVTTGVAGAAGLTWDRILRHWGTRNVPKVGTRVQADYVFRDGGDAFLRVSGGLLLRW